MLINKEIKTCENCIYRKNGNIGYECGMTKEIQFLLRKRNEPTDSNYCVILNKDNNCTFYKRKWWKFWKPKGIEKKV